MIKLCHQNFKCPLPLLKHIDSVFIYTATKGWTSKLNSCHHVHVHVPFPNVLLLFVIWYFLKCSCGKRALSVVLGKSPFGMIDVNNLPHDSQISRDDITLDQTVPQLTSPRGQVSPGSGSQASPNDRFSRKVFVGGLPPDIDEGNKFRHCLWRQFSVLYTCLSFRLALKL